MIKKGLRIGNVHLKRVKLHESRKFTVKFSGVMFSRLLRDGDESACLLPYKRFWNTKFRFETKLQIWKFLRSSRSFNILYANISTKREAFPLYS